MLIHKNITVTFDIKSREDLPKLRAFMKVNNFKINKSKIAQQLNEDSLIRLMGAVLLERNEVISSARCIFNTKTYEKLFSPELSGKLIKIADEQRRLLAT